MSDRISELALEAIALGLDVLACSFFYVQWRRLISSTVDLSTAEQLSLENVDQISNTCWQRDYVTARGRVIPYGEPLTSMFRDHEHGVIREVSIVDQVRRASSHANKWTEKPNVLSSFVNSIPFGLVTARSAEDMDAAAPSVAVTQWREADRLDLTTVYDNTKTWISLGRTVNDHVAHLYEHRLRTTERMLLSGQLITVAGQLKIGPEGGLTLVPPGGGKPYFIVDSEPDELIREIRKSAAASNRLLWFCVGIGVILVGRMAFVGWQQRRRRNVLSRVHETLRMIQRGRPRSAWGPSGDSICTVCRHMPVEVELSGCRHSCLCADCAIRIVQEDPRCPICRELISQVSPLT